MLISCEENTVKVGACVDRRHIFINVTSTAMRNWANGLKVGRAVRGARPNAARERPVGAALAAAHTARMATQITAKGGVE